MTRTTNGGPASADRSRAQDTQRSGGTPDPPRFTLAMKVRDYECDLQQIVNNAVYQHYFEHTRHEFLQQIGLDFAELHRRGIDLVLVHAELDYHLPLRSGDRFVVTLDLAPKGRLCYTFDQAILRLPDRTPVVTARFRATSLRDGRPAVVPEVDRALRAAGANQLTAPDPPPPAPPA